MIASRPISSSEAERLLNAESVNGGFGELVSLVATLRAMPPPSVDRALLERVAIAAAVTARSTEARPAATAPTPRRGVRLRYRLATGAAAMTLVLGSGTGVAIAADGAAPGDSLYGLDRALESVAIGNGGIAERLEEAANLVAAGHLAAGLEHAADTLAADHAGDAIRAAALRVAATADASTASGGAEVQTAIGDVLAYLSKNIGDVDATTVAKLSNLIGDGAAG
jgi:hypothetical protein